MQVLLQELEEAMPTLERGRSWLASVLDDGPIVRAHPDVVLSAVTALRIVATSGWISVVEHSAYADRLNSDQILRTLGAMLVWQVVALAQAASALAVRPGRTMIVLVLDATVHVAGM